MHAVRMTSDMAVSFLLCLMGYAAAVRGEDVFTSYKFGRVSFGDVLSAPDVACDVLVNSRSLVQCAHSCQHKTITGE